MHKLLSICYGDAEKCVCVCAVECVLQDTQQALPAAELDPQEMGLCLKQRLLLVFPPAPCLIQTSICVLRQNISYCKICHEGIRYQSIHMYKERRVEEIFH